MVLVKLKNQSTESSKGTSLGQDVLSNGGLSMQLEVAQK